MERGVRAAGFSGRHSAAWFGYRSRWVLSRPDWSIKTCGPNTASTCPAWWLLWRIGAICFKHWNNNSKGRTTEEPILWNQVWSCFDAKGFIGRPNKHQNRTSLLFQGKRKKRKKYPTNFVFHPETIAFLFFINFAFSYFSPPQKFRVKKISYAPCRFRHIHLRFLHSHVFLVVQHPKKNFAFLHFMPQLEKFRLAWMIDGELRLKKFPLWSHFSVIFMAVIIPAYWMINGGYQELFYLLQSKKRITWNERCKCNAAPLSLICLKLMAWCFRLNQTHCQTRSEWELRRPVQLFHLCAGKWTLWRRTVVLPYKGKFPIVFQKKKKKKKKSHFRKTHKVSPVWSRQYFQNTWGSWQEHEQTIIFCVQRSKNNFLFFFVFLFVNTFGSCQKKEYNMFNISPTRSWWIGPESESDPHNPAFHFVQKAAETLTRDVESDLVVSLCGTNSRLVFIAWKACSAEIHQYFNGTIATVATQTQHQSGTFDLEWLSQTRIASRLPSPDADTRWQWWME